jgi:hypothetical protein
VLAQRGAFIGGAEQATPLQHRNHHEVGALVIEHMQLALIVELARRPSCALRVERGDRRGAVVRATASGNACCDPSGSRAPHGSAQATASRRA